MRLGLRLSCFLIFGLATVALALSAHQSRNARDQWSRDLERHALELAESLDRAAAPLIMNRSAETRSATVPTASFFSSSRAT